MRPSALAALLSMTFLLAGCASDDTGEGPASAEQESTFTPTVPEPLHFEGEVSVGADPFNVVPPAPVGSGMPCSMEVSTCYYHEFTVGEDAVGNGTVSLTATLAWGLAANDLDLYLYQGEEQLSSDGINSLGAAEPPPTEQVLRHEGLAAGEYSLWVVVWNGAADSYTLDVEFSS